MDGCGVMAILGSQLVGEHYTLHITHYTCTLLHITVPQVCPSTVRHRKCLAHNNYQVLTPPPPPLGPCQADFSQADGGGGGGGVGVN